MHRKVLRILNIDINIQIYTNKANSHKLKKKCTQMYHYGWSLMIKTMPNLGKQAKNA